MVLSLVSVLLDYSYVCICCLVVSIHTSNNSGRQSVNCIKHKYNYRLPNKNAQYYNKRLTCWKILNTNVVH